MNVALKFLMILFFALAINGFALLVVGVVMEAFFKWRKYIRGRK
jgi:hypothetical protein